MTAIYRSFIMRGRARAMEIVNFIGNKYRINQKERNELEKQIQIILEKLISLGLVVNSNE